MRSLITILYKLQIMPWPNGIKFQMNSFQLVEDTAACSIVVILNQDRHLFSNYHLFLCEYNLPKDSFNFMWELFLYPSKSYITIEYYVCAVSVIL